MTFPKVLQLGNEILDAEHRKIHGTLTRLTISLAQSDVAALLQIFEILENDLRAYFAIEESIAKTIGFDFAQHNLSHQNLLDEMQHVRNSLVAKNCSLLEHEERGYIDLLHRYLTLHIMLDSRPLKRALSSGH